MTASNGHVQNTCQASLAELHSMSTVHVKPGWLKYMPTTHIKPVGLKAFLGTHISTVISLFQANLASIHVAALEDMFIGVDLCSHEKNGFGTGWKL